MVFLTLDFVQALLVSGPLCPPFHLCLLFVCHLVYLFQAIFSEVLFLKMWFMNHLYHNCLGMYFKNANYFVPPHQTYWMSGNLKIDTFIHIPGTLFYKLNLIPAALDCVRGLVRTPKAISISPSIRLLPEIIAEIIQLILQSDWKLIEITKMSSSW